MILARRRSFRPLSFAYRTSLSAGLLLGGPRLAAADAALPFAVRVQVTQQGTVAADRSLRLLESAILVELRRCGCAPDAVVGPPAVGSDSVALSVVIKDVSEEARWDMPTGARAEAIQRQGEESVEPTTVIRVLARAQVLAGPLAAEARAREFTVTAEWNAKAHGRDPADEVRQEAIEKLAVEARKTLCDSRRKLLSRIHELGAP